MDNPREGGVRSDGGGALYHWGSGLQPHAGADAHSLERGGGTGRLCLQGFRLAGAAGFYAGPQRVCPGGDRP